MFDNWRSCVVAGAAALLMGAWGPSLLTLWLAKPQMPSVGSLAALVQSKCDPSRTVVEADFSEAMNCSDLAAQDSMARSTARLQVLGWLQLAVSVGGTGLVVLSLRQAARAADLTSKAVEQQVRALEHQQAIDKSTLRARLGTKNIEPFIDDKGGIHFDLAFVNKGQTNARRTRICYVWKVVDGQPTKSELEELPRKWCPPGVLIAGKDSAKVTVYLKGKIAAAVLRGEKSLQFAMFAIYDDEFDGRFRSARNEVMFWKNGHWNSSRIEGVAIPGEFKGRTI